MSDHFVQYRAIAFDGWCDGPISWAPAAAPPPRYGALGDDVRSYGERDPVGPRDHWVFVERWLTPPQGAWE